MNLTLAGPFALDLGAVSWSGRAALEGWRKAPRRPVSEARSKPGLYVIVHEESKKLSVAGFWMVFSEDYLAGGPAGPPDKAPPFVRELLTAATESVWWVNLPTWPKKTDTWNPLAILEWPAALSARSSVPPPGAPLPEDAAGAPPDNFDDWSPPPERRSNSGLSEETLALPPSRSLVVIARCRLTRTRATHSGGYTMIPPAMFPEGRTALELNTWLDMAYTEKIPAIPDQDHHLGRPLELSVGKVGFVLSGWLTKDLALWPPNPRDIRPAVLSDRDVGSPLFRQGFQAITSTAGVISVALVLGLAVQWASRPSFGEAPETVAAEAQPALATCSADNQLFMDELRCQVAHAAAGGSPDDPVCMSSESGTTQVSGDLQAAFCGLSHRPVDGAADNVEAGTRALTMAEQAATRACFNVLRKPYRYDLNAGLEVKGGEKPATKPDPYLFLHDPSLRIASLAALVEGLHEHCDGVRTRLERKVAGAVVATHLGTSEASGEGAQLRSLVADKVTATFHRAEEKDCFRMGMTNGALGDVKTDDICGNGTIRDPLVQKGWDKLGEVQDTSRSVLRTYALARFGPSPNTSELEDLWSCYYKLEQNGSVALQTTSWHLLVGVANAWNTDAGVVRSQLELDSLLRDMQTGPAPSSCWKMTANLLSAYQPVHPLIAAPEEGSWPSYEQQLCGQICAVRYKIRSGVAEADWKTRKTDLDMCLGPRLCMTEGEDGRWSLCSEEWAEENPGKVRYARLGLGPPSTTPSATDQMIDYLRMPWNAPRGQDNDNWRLADDEAVCSFNLISQGYFPTGDEGSVLLEGMTPVDWAGGAVDASGKPLDAVAGGPDGASTQAAQAMNSYGRAHGIATCGYVAAQCFSERMLNVTGDPSNAPHRWVERWNEELDHLDRKENPWCDLILPYMGQRGASRDGQLDFPCARGVDQTRTAFAAVLGELAMTRTTSVQR